MSTVSEFTNAPLKRKIQIWVEAVRAPFFTAVLVPVLLASIIAWEQGYPIQVEYFFLTLIAGILLHAGTNVINDYADHKSGCDQRNVEFVRPFTGGSRSIQNGTLSPRQVLMGSIIFLSLSTILGLLLVYLKGMPILYLGLIGTFCAVFYTLPPFNLAAKGVGELAVGLCFGTLMMLGAYYVQAQAFNIEVVVASIPVSLLIAGILYINEFPDYVADKDSGKSHLVVRMGRPRAYYGYLIIIVLTYLSIVIGVVTKTMTPYCLIALITLPKAIQAVRITSMHHSNTPDLVPANAATVVVHLMTGLLLSVGYIVAAIL